MADTPENLDRLEIVFRRLSEQVRKKEAELEQLRKKLDVIEQARLLVLSEISSGEAAAIQMAARASPQNATLQSSVRDVVLASHDESGISPADVAHFLRERGWGQTSDKNSFYTACYVALKRLVEKGEIDSIQGSSGRRFRRKDATQSLFRSH